MQTGGPQDRSSFLGQVSGLRQIFPDGIRYEITGITDGGDRVAVEASGHGKVQGMTLHNRYHLLFEISDGTVIRARGVSRPGLPGSVPGAGDRRVGGLTRAHAQRGVTSVGSAAIPLRANDGNGTISCRGTASSRSNWSNSAGRLKLASKRANGAPMQ